MDTTHYDVIVIGGGAAGFFAAIQCKNLDKNLAVGILEKSNHVLAKVKVSGGGRCNVTHHMPEVKQLLTHYPRGQKELHSPFTNFNILHTIEWFESKGVKLKIEPDGRMFPVTNSSQTIIDCLLNEISKYKIPVMFNCDVLEITKAENKFRIVCRDERTFTCSKLIVATGGFNKASSYDFIAKTGVRIVAPVPSLFSFKIQNSPFKDLPGSVIQNALVTIVHTKQSMQGPLLITHEGMSGPAILKLSALAARELYECQYVFSIRINALPMQKQDPLRQKLNEMKIIHAQKKVGNTPLSELTSRLWNRYCELSNISPEDVWQSVSKKDINVLCEKLQNLAVDVNGKSLNKEEFVTCGGVDLKQINLQRMEHKQIPNLFFAGEIMNVDGVTGGFNFQHAWTSGYIAACGAAGGGE